MKLLALFIPVLALVSCAGYQLGGVKPASLAHVKTISVPMFTNGTLHPQASALATSAVASAVAQDGTYRIARGEDADAVLEGTLRDIRYSVLRGNRLDSLRPEELENRVTLQWILRDGRDPTRVLASGTSTGRSQLFVSANLQTARNNALPEALERAAEALVATVANGY